MEIDDLVIAAVGTLRGGSLYLYARVQEQAGRDYSADEAREMVRRAEGLYQTACEAAEAARECSRGDDYALMLLVERAPGYARRVYDYVLSAAYFDTR